jgi:type I restriction enzyme S subunit
VKSQFIELFSDETKQVRLDELCLHFGDGDWIESKDQSEEGIRLIQTGNVGNGEYKDKDDKARYVSEETFIRLGCTEVFPGDILISRLPDPIGRACIVPEMPKSITAVDCTIVRLKSDILSTFFVNFTKTPMYTMQIDSFTTGSTRKRISRANLGSVMVPVPDLTRQERFVSIAEQSDKSKFVVSNRNLSRCLAIQIPHETQYRLKWPLRLEMT